MEFLLLALSLIFVLVAIFTKFSKSGTLLAVVSLAGYLYLAASMLQWQAVVLVTTGLVLVFLEIFIPSFGLIGILGAGTLYWGLVQVTGSPEQAAIDLVLSLILTVIFFMILFKSGAITKNADRIVLKTTSTAPQNDESSPEETSTLHVGMMGKTVTPLRPAGKVQLANQKIIDVISNGVHLEKGTPVEIEEIVGSKIIVRKVYEENL